MNVCLGVVSSAAEHSMKSAVEEVKALPTMLQMER